MNSSTAEQSFKYVPINQLYDVIKEKEKICSGYYIDIHKQLEILGDSYNKNIEQNPFCVAEHHSTEYLRHLKNQNHQMETVKPNVEQLVPEIPNVNLDNVFENMSPEDIDVLENILNNSLKGVVAQDLKKQTNLKMEKKNPERFVNRFKCLEEIEFESDSDSVVLVSKFPNHNCLELGVAKALIKLHRK